MQLLHNSSGDTVHVIFTLSFFRLTGARSPWHGYLLSLPEKTNIALLWGDSVEDDKEALIWIRGTMAEKEHFEGASHEAQGSGNFVSVSLASCRDVFFNMCRTPQYF